MFSRANGVQYFGYKTGFFDLLVRSDQVTEYHVDSTFQTNRAGFELFGVVANVYGSGYPIAYLILKVDSSSTNIDENDTNKIAILKIFFQKMKDQGLNPTFMFCDKDASEINAIEAVWRSEQTIVRLCLWHLHRAVKTHLATKMSRSLPPYFPGDAANEFDFVDPRFTPANDNRRVAGRVIAVVDHRKAITEMMGIHYNRHHFIPIGKDLFSKKGKFMQT